MSKQGTQVEVTWDIIIKNTVSSVFHHYLRLRQITKLRCTHSAKSKHQSCSKSGCISSFSLYVNKYIWKYLELERQRIIQPYFIFSQIVTIWSNLAFLVVCQAGERWKSKMLRVATWLSSNSNFDRHLHRRRRRSRSRRRSSNRSRPTRQFDESSSRSKRLNEARSYGN